MRSVRHADSRVWSLLSLLVVTVLPALAYVTGWAQGRAREFDLSHGTMFLLFAVVAVLLAAFFLWRCIAFTRRGIVPVVPFLCLLILVLAAPPRLYVAGHRAGERQVLTEVPASELARECFEVIKRLQDKGKARDAILGAADLAEFPLLSRLRPSVVQAMRRDNGGGKGALQDWWLIVKLSSNSAYVFDFEREANTWVLRLSHREGASRRVWSGVYSR